MGSNPAEGANLMEGYLTGDVSTALKAVGAERPGDQYHQPSANYRRKEMGSMNT